MIWFLYREYTKARGAIYDWNKDNLHRCIDTTQAEKRRKDNEQWVQEVEITLPPDRIVKVNIPVRESGEEDSTFQEEVLTDIMIDPKVRLICNKILEKYKFCAWWFFVSLGNDAKKKMHTKNMEALQMMKDVIMGYIRYEPLALEYTIGKAGKKEKITYDWDITQDFKDVMYTVWGKKYKTDVYGVYTRRLRKAMIEKYFDFYWGHEFQYWQREFNLNYWAINYLCASREIGKCVEENSIIEMADGSQKKAKDIVVGDELLASDWSSSVIVKEKATFIKDCYELKYWGNSCVVSHDHRIPTIVNYDKVGKVWDSDVNNYTQAKDIQEYDLIMKKGWKFIRVWENNFVWKKKVVHLHVTGDELFWCNDILVHNTFLGLYDISIPIFKSPTLLKEKNDKAYLDTHFYVPVESVIENYSQKLKWFMHSLLVDTYQLNTEVANQIIEWVGSDWKMYLHTKEWSRSINFVSQLATSRRGSRSSRAILDEANYMSPKKYIDISEFATKSGAGSVNYISTISIDSKKSNFYKEWTEAMIKSRNNVPIDEAIHRTWTKFWFDKLKSKDDYKKMVDNQVFAKARAFFYSLRPIWGQKVTLDDSEVKTQEEKNKDIQSAIDSTTGYDGMLAEYFCELSKEKWAIDYRKNIIRHDAISNTFEKIYAGYDEAEDYDEPWFVVGGVLDWKIYVIGQYILPIDINERFKVMNEILEYREARSDRTPSVIHDLGRWPWYYREASAAVSYIDMAIKTRHASPEKVAKSAWVKYYQVSTEVLIKQIINQELINGNILFFSDSLSSKITVKKDWEDVQIDSLFTQLDNYKLVNWTYRGEWKKVDDNVSALIYMAYYAYNNYIKNDGIKNNTQTHEDKNMAFHRRVLNARKPKKRKGIWRKR